ncbi:MAG TPA: hypothetical protein VGE74_17530 [Gemmata sp.]
MIRKLILSAVLATGAVAGVTSTATAAPDVFDRHDHDRRNNTCAPVPGSPSEHRPRRVRPPLSPPPRPVWFLDTSSAPSACGRHLNCGIRPA